MSRGPETHGGPSDSGMGSRGNETPKETGGESEGWEEKSKHVIPLISRKTLIMNCAALL